MVPRLFYRRKCLAMINNMPLPKSIVGLVSRRKSLVLKAFVLLVLGLIAAVFLSSLVKAVYPPQLKLDYSGGTIVPPWKAIQAAASDRVTIANDPAGGTGKVARFELRYKDLVSGSSRAEVYYKSGSNGTELNGEDSYYPMSVYFPAGFKPAQKWSIFMQVHGADDIGAQPPIAYELRPNGQIRIAVRGGQVTSPVTKMIDPAGVNVIPGQWQDFILHWKKSYTSTGLVEVWYRTANNSFTKVASYSGPNFFAQGTVTKPAYIKQGFYRDTGSSTDTTFPNIVYHKGIWKTADFDSAVAYFGSTPPPPPPPDPDTAAPSAPTNLIATQVSDTSATLNWDASADTGGSGLAGYNIYRDSVQVGTTANTSFTNTGLNPSTAYSYTVVAYDNASNNSEASAPLTVTTQDPLPPPPVNVLLKLDYSSGALIPPWKFVQAAAPDRITVVNNPAGGSTKVGRFELRAGDRHSGSARAEVYYQAGANGTTGTEFNGADDYYAMSVFFPADFKPSTKWGLFMQVHGASGVGVQPPIAFETRPYPNDQLRLVVRGGDVNQTITSKTFDPAGMVITRGQWQDFILRWKKSAVNGQGIVDLWYRTGGQANPFVKVVSNYTGPNFYVKGTNAPPGYIKQGYYRDNGTSSDATYPHVVYHKGIWKTADFDSAATYFPSLP